MMEGIRMFNLAWFYRVNTERLRQKIEKLHFPGEDKTRNLPDHKPFELSRTQEDLTTAQAYVLDFVNKFKIREIVEVGAEMGDFTSQLLDCRTVRKIICLESDAVSANDLFKEARRHKLPVTVALMDVAYPHVLRRGLPPDIHYRAEAVVALDITGKYIKTRYWPAEDMMAVFSEWTSKYLFFEVSDPASGGEGDHVNMKYYHDTVENLYSAFKKRFSILHEESVGAGRKLLIGKRRITEPSNDLSQKQNGDTP